MTDQQPHERDPRRPAGPGNSGSWQPVPGGGDYDPDQTMHVSFAAQLPPEPRPGEDPLGAHGPAGPGYPAQAEQEGGYQVGMPLYGTPDGGYLYRPEEHGGPGHSGAPGVPPAAGGPGAPGIPGQNGGPGSANGPQGPARPDGRDTHGRPYEPGPYAPESDPAGGHGGPAGDPDPATSWSIPVIREEAEAESGEYSVGAFAPSWDQAPSPAPTQSFPAGMFGQGAAAAQAAARARAAEAAASAERTHGGADTAPGGEAGHEPGPGADSGPVSGPWDMPFTGPEGGDAVPWLPAHAPAADAAWAGLVDDPEGPPPAAGDRTDGQQAFDAPPGQEGPAGHDDPAVGGGYGAAAFAGHEPHGGQIAPGGQEDGERAAVPDGPDTHAEAGRTAAPGELADPGDPDGPIGPYPVDAADPADGPDGPPRPDGLDAPDAAVDPPGAAETAAPAGELEPSAEPEPEPEPEPAPEQVEPTRSEHPLASYMLRVNGTDRPVTDAWLGESLLYVLRERLGLAGAKDGCEQGECGACSVQVDGRLVASCLVPAATAAGSEVRTVEGLTVEGRPSDVQRALAECGAVQCGFCIPGMAMTVHDLLEGNHKPTDLDVRHALSGNLCRCSGYRGVLDAVRQVVADRGTDREGDRDTDDPPTADDPTRVPHQGGPSGQGGAQ
jgi:aerobic-type carbon monoxide dehydrogenase small subunit (CoxS/CutS family)